MPNYTKTIQLEKPLQTETYDVDKRNANWDKIDNAFTEQDKSIKKIKEDLDEKQDKGKYAHLGEDGKVLTTELPEMKFAHLDEQGKVKKEELPNVDSYPIGAIIQVFGKQVPDGYLILNGQEINRSLYSALWAYASKSGLLISEKEWQIQNSKQESVGYFSSGDTINTFRIPKLQSYTRAALTVDEVGQWQDDAIRNITGDFSGSGQRYANTPNTVNGAFYVKNTQNSPHEGAAMSNGGENDDWFGFDASRVVPTADENRPKTIKMLYCIKAFSGECNVAPSDALTVIQKIENWITASGNIKMWEVWKYD